MSGKYVLNEHGDPVPEEDLFTWAAKFTTTNRHVADDTVNGMRVSTVFMGIDHNFLGRGDPLLYETMVFDSDDDFHDRYCERYSAKEGALEGHKRAIEWAKNQRKMEDQ